MWNVDYTQCIQCNSSHMPFYAKGMCKKCYDKAWSVQNKEHRNEVSPRKKRMQKRRNDRDILHAKRKQSLDLLTAYVKKGEHLIYTKNKTIIRTEKGEFYMPTPAEDTMSYHVEEFRKLLDSHE